MYALSAALLVEVAFQGRQAGAAVGVVVAEVVVVVEVAAEEEVTEVEGAEAVVLDRLEEAEEEVEAGSCLVCLPLIHVWAFLAACLALALPLSLSFSSSLSFFSVTLSSSAFAFFMATVCLASFSLTSSLISRIPFCPPLVAGTGAAGGTGSGVAAGVEEGVAGGAWAVAAPGSV